MQKPQNWQKHGMFEEFKKDLRRGGWKDRRVRAGGRPGLLDLIKVFILMKNK